MSLNAIAPLLETFALFVDELMPEPEPPVDSLAWPKNGYAPPGTSRLAEAVAQLSRFEVFAEWMPSAWSQASRVPSGVNVGLAARNLLALAAGIVIVHFATGWVTSLAVVAKRRMSAWVMLPLTSKSSSYTATRLPLRDATAVRSGRYGSSLGPCPFAEAT